MKALGIWIASILANLVRWGSLLLFAALITSHDTPAFTGTFVSLCELSKDFPSFRDKLVTVRGVYYYGLRQECPQKCSVGPWPSFVDLEGGGDEAWAVLASTNEEVEFKAKKSGNRFEIWVTVVGRLQTRAERSPPGPCDQMSRRGYGPLGGYPAQITVESFRDIEVRVNAHSPYDYAHMYHGPA